MAETKKCKHCRTEIDKKAKVCSNCKKKQGGNGKWIVLGIIIFFAVVGALGDGDKDNTEKVSSDSTNISAEAPENVQEDLITAPAAETDSTNEGEDDSIPKEFKSALNKASTYSSTMHMSKSAIYNQLTSEYGEKFSAEAAQYAMDNFETDWKENALEKAKGYSSTMHMSKAAIYDQLISEFGEQFTEEEAQYAIDNVIADWNENALKKAKSYQEDMDMSPEAIRDQLSSEYGEKFTAEEADYAISNLN